QEEAEPLHALAENVPGQQRDPDTEVEYAEADHEEHPEHRADLGRVQSVHNALRDVLTDGRRARAARATLHADRGQRGEDEKVARAAEHERRRPAEAGDDEAGRGGTHDPCAIERRWERRAAVSGPSAAG